MSYFNLTKLFPLVLALLIALPLSLCMNVGNNQLASALERLWKNIPRTQQALGDSAVGFPVDPTKANAWGLTYMYGCTGIMIGYPGRTQGTSHPYVILGHLQQDNGRSEGAAFDDTAHVKRWIEKLLDEEAQFNHEEGNPTVVILYSNPPGRPEPKGLKLLEKFVRDHFNVASPRVINYPSSQGIGTVNGPNGKAVVQWVPGHSRPHGSLNFYWNVEAPIAEMTI